MAHVVVIGDELAIADRAAVALRRSGHEVELASTASAVAALASRRPGVVVLLKPMSLPDGLMALIALRSLAGMADLAGILVSTPPAPDQVARGGRCGDNWRVIDAASYCPTALPAAVEALTQAP
jgi:CheY-like chemotaxis protein